MKHVLLALCGSALLAAGCVGTPKEPPLTGGSTDQQAESHRRRHPPSAEASVVLRKLSHVDEFGKVRADWDLGGDRGLEYLEGELKKVGARLGPDGKIYDRNGREVFVWEEKPTPGVYGWVEPPQIAQEREKELCKLRQQYTVVLLPFYGIQPP